MEHNARRRSFFCTCHRFLIFNTVRLRTAFWLPWNLKRMAVRNDSVYGARTGWHVAIYQRFHKNRCLGLSRSPNKHAHPWFCIWRCSLRSSELWAVHGKSTSIFQPNESRIRISGGARWAMLTSSSYAAFWQRQKNFGSASLINAIRVKILPIHKIWWQ